MLLLLKQFDKTVHEYEICVSYSVLVFAIVAFLLLDKCLESQNVKNSGQMMVLMLLQSSAETELQQKKEEEAKASASRTRQAAEVLSSRKDSEWILLILFALY